MNNLSDKTIGQLSNLLTLLVGITVGICIGYMLRSPNSVEAQAVPRPSPAVEEISPTMTVGSIGTNILLSHQVATDQLMINGFDVMRMQQNILQYLANRPGAERADIQNLINASYATTVYRMKPQPKPQLPAPDKK